MLLLLARARFGDAAGDANVFCCFASVVAVEVGVVVRVRVGVLGRGSISLLVVVFELGALIVLLLLPFLPVLVT